MSAEVIAAILNALAAAIPEVMTLFTQASSGTAVSATQVQAIITKYGVDQAVFTAAIAAAKAKGL
jgi:hypothetical protein